MYEFFSEAMNSVIFFVIAYGLSEIIHQKEQTGYSGLFVGLYILINSKPRLGIFIIGILIGVYDLITGYIPIIDVLNIIKLLLNNSETY